MIKDLKKKLAKYMSDMRKLRTRRDRAGVRQYEEARRHYLRLLERKEIFGDRGPSSFGYVMVTKIQNFFISTPRIEESIIGLKD